MIGTIQGYAMSKEPVYCRADKTGKVLYFIAEGLGDDPKDYEPSLAIGFYQGEKLIGGVLINDIRPGRDCWITIYSTTPEWGKRHVMKYVFNVVYNVIGAKRCSAFISESNKQSYSVCKRLGFKQEGLLREYRDNGENCYVMGMLKQECIWI